MATSQNRDEGKPEYFGKAGDTLTWHADGWSVPVARELLERSIRLRLHMEGLTSDLPRKYSPIRVNGADGQGVYLVLISRSRGEDPGLGRLLGT